MCSRQDVGKGFKIPEIQDSSQLDGEELDSILKALEKMEKKFQSNFQETVDGIGGIQRGIRDADERFGELVDDILFCFEKFERQISYEIEKSKTKGFVPEPFFGRAHNLTMADTACRQDLSYLCRIDKNRAQKPTNSELLSDIKEKLRELERMSNDEFSQVFKAIQKIKESQQDTRQQDKLKNVQKRFNMHEEFIRTNLPIPQ